MHSNKYLVDYGIDRKMLKKEFFASNPKKSKDELNWLKGRLDFHNYFTHWLDAEKEYRKSYNKESIDQSDGVAGKE